MKNLLRKYLGIFEDLHVIRISKIDLDYSKRTIHKYYIFNVLIFEITLNSSNLLDVEKEFIDKYDK